MGLDSLLSQALTDLEPRRSAIRLDCRLNRRPRRWSGLRVARAERIRALKSVKASAEEIAGFQLH